jgi:fibronectin type 3 domain-containing protein
MIGSSQCTSNIERAGLCNSEVVSRVITAALGGPCITSNPHSVSLNWIASTSANVAGYNVYRAGAAGRPYTKLNSSLVLGTSYTDAGVQAGQTYYYVATTMDTMSAESAYSNVAAASVPSP